MVCITDKDGLIIEETKYDNTILESQNFARHLNEKYGGSKCTAVVESTANMWIKTYKALEQFGIQTKLANPFKTRVIAEARIKTDKLDAHMYIMSFTTIQLDTRIICCSRQDKRGPISSTIED